MKLLQVSLLDHRRYHRYYQHVPVVNARILARGLIDYHSYQHWYLLETEIVDVLLDAVAAVAEADNDYPG